MWQRQLLQVSTSLEHRPVVVVVLSVIPLTDSSTDWFSSPGVSVKTA